MIELSPEQCRIIGVMLEKETTTPEQYPLSINGLTNGCNQKSNREPVMNLSEIEVQTIVDELVASNQMLEDHASGGRVNKYKHRFCNTPFGGMQLTEQQRAIICVLFLRGPQTPGELRSRTNRLANFRDVNQVEEVLRELSGFNGEVFVKKLPREAGKRESRYVHLFTDLPEAELVNSSLQSNIVPNTSDVSQTLLERIELLEQQVAALSSEVETLKQQS